MLQGNHFRLSSRRIILPDLKAVQSLIFQHLISPRCPTSSQLPCKHLSQQENCHIIQTFDLAPGKAYRPVCHCTTSRQALCTQTQHSVHVPHAEHASCITGKAAITPTPTQVHSWIAPPNTAAALEGKGREGGPSEACASALQALPESLCPWAQAAAL